MLLIREICSFVGMKTTNFIGKDQKVVHKIEFIYNPLTKTKIKIGANVYTIEYVVDEFTDNPNVHIRHIYVDKFQELIKQIL